MAKDKDISKSFFTYALVATVLAVVFLMLKKDNLFTWIQAGITLHKQEKQIEAYENDIERLDEQIRMMTGNRDTLEKFARETFYFNAPGEDVYILEE